MKMLSEFHIDKNTFPLNRDPWATFQWKSQSNSLRKEWVNFFPRKKRDSFILRYLDSHKLLSKLQGKEVLRFQIAWRKYLECSAQCLSSQTHLKTQCCWDLYSLWMGICQLASCQRHRSLFILLAPRSSLLAPTSYLKRMHILFCVKTTYAKYQFYSFLNWVLSWDFQTWKHAKYECSLNYELH